MRKSTNSAAGWTLVELMISLCVFSALMLGLIYYTVMISHMIARNMTVNHSHDTSRSTVERAWSDLHNSASYFVLMSYDGSTYTDVTPSYSSTSDVDLYYYTGSTGYVINDNRANAVRFMVLGGGPYPITGDGNGSATVAATATSVEVNAYDGYIPVVGDKIVIPVINQTFDIITPAPVFISGTSYKINIGLISGSGSSSTTSSQAIGTTIYTTATTTTTGFSYGPTSSTNPLQYPAFTSASIYHRVAYTVYNNQFQYHPNFTPPPQGYPAGKWSANAADQSSTVTLRTNVTSPLPFGLLAATSAGPALQTFLRMSLESYDLTYAVGMYTDGTTTVQTTIPSRTVPPVITSY